MRAVASARWGVLAIGAFAVAFALRLGFVLASQGGITGNFGYDPSVYYSAADALIHGRVPYRDFVLLHPPGLILVLSPFAFIGRLTTDETGFVAANTAVSLIGSANAALVVLVARRIGFRWLGALLGSAFYAVWYGTVTSELSARLEPLGTFAFLCGLLVLLPPHTATRRRTVLAGVGFGAAMCVKIWWVVPALIVAGWLLRTRDSRRPISHFAGGVVVALVAVDGPFFVLAPRAMFRMVVADQLGRNRANPSDPVHRLAAFSSLQSLVPQTLGALTALVGGFLLVAGLIAWAAWRTRAARLLIVIAAAQIVVLLAAPTYFGYYRGYAAGATALVIAAAAERAPERDRARRRVLTAIATAGATAVVATAGAVTVIPLFARSNDWVLPFPGPPLAARVVHVRCVMADSPMALIELDALSRDLAHGCPDWVDVSGRTYGVDAPPHGEPLVRSHNRKWQADLRRYLLSGNAAVIIRTATGFSAATQDTIEDLPVLARDHGITVYRVPSARRIATMPPHPSPAT